ncbi:MAG: MaoC/PaaZ C-terminal domain-containing protein [Candidatus Hodarchaeales archaeon]
MEILSNLVTTALNETSKQISWRDIMMYATAISDNNPYYLNDERDGGIIAHPLFPVSITLPIVENLPDHISKDSPETFPFELMMTVVHYSEHLIIHRIIQTNDFLRITGKIEAILSHRAGTHVILKFRGEDKFNRPVFTEYLGGMLRGVECVGGEKGRERIPVLPISEAKDAVIWEKEHFIQPLQSHIYDGCVGPTLPFHTSKEIAHQLGLPDLILQGVCTLALAVSKIIDEELDGDPTQVSEIACKFTSMVIPDSKVKIRVTDRIENISDQEIFFDVHNDRNKKAIREGYLKIS